MNIYIYMAVRIAVIQAEIKPPQNGKMVGWDNMLLTLVDGSLDRYRHFLFGQADKDERV